MERKELIDLGFYLAYMAVAAFAVVWKDTRAMRLPLQKVLSVLQAHQQAKTL